MIEIRWKGKKKIKIKDGKNRKLMKENDEVKIKG
jgi:hypothetical protein